MLKHNPALTLLKILILLAPLPFGCVGRIFSPLFYLLVLIFTLIAIGQAHSPSHFLYEKKVRLFFYVFIAFLAFQSIPLPVFLLKIISPAVVRNLAHFKDQVPAFHSLSLVPYETIVFAAKFIVFALFFQVMINLDLEKKEIFSIADTLALSAGLQAALGLLKYLQGNRYFFLFFYEIDKSDKLARFLTGTLGNPDHFAFYLEMILPIVLALFFLKLQYFEGGKSLREKFLSAIQESKRTAAYFILIVLLGCAVVLSGSRAGIMTMIFSFMIFAQFSFYLKRSRTVRKKLKLFFIIIAAAVVLLGVQNTVGKFLSTRIENSGRFLRWPATLDMAGDYLLFGSGFGSYRYVYFLYDPDEGGEWSTHAHSDYLETAAEGGVIGSLLFFLVIGAAMFSIIKMWLERKRPDVKMMGIGIITGMFAAALHSVFDFSLHIPANAFTFVLVLVLGIKIATYKREFSG
ncbi:MAG: O-antigen ligase family protein [Candidatus Aminicenantes bacterium]|nr:O-antigen ligase family protein [Candidatus Aminicenantes bacterium]